MKLSELKEQIDRIVEYAPRDADSEVMVGIRLPYTTVGAMPMMEITSIHQGFDWEHGKIILSTKEPLMPFDKDIGDKLRKTADKLASVEYKNKRLTDELVSVEYKNKLLTDELDKLKKELDELKIHRRENND